MDLADLHVGVMALSLAAGLALGRWRALAVPVVLTALVYLGIRQDWWAGGLADGWRRFFLWETAIGVAVAAAGVGINRLVDRRRPVPPVARAVPVLACVVGLGAYWWSSTRPPDLTPLRSSRRTLFYLGASFEGYRLTHATVDRRGAYLAYGDCDLQVGLSEGGCSVPLGIENVTCPAGRTAVVLWGGRGDGLLARARRALRPVDADRRASPPPVSFNVNAFGDCFPPRGSPRPSAQRAAGAAAGRSPLSAAAAPSPRKTDAVA